MSLKKKTLGLKKYKEKKTLRDIKTETYGRTLNRKKRGKGNKEEWKKKEEIGEINKTMKEYE